MGSRDRNPVAMPGPAGMQSALGPEDELEDEGNSSDGSLSEGSAGTTCGGEAGGEARDAAVGGARGVGCAMCRAMAMQGAAGSKLMVEKRDCKISEGKEVETETASASNEQGPEYEVVVDREIQKVREKHSCHIHHHSLRMMRVHKVE